MYTTHMSKVLIIEDDDNWQQIYSTLLMPRGVNVIPAYTLEDARDLFIRHRDLDAIVVDGQIGPADADITSLLVREFRIDGFTGPIVAASSSETNCIKLVNAGCNYHVYGDKDLTVQTLVQVLNL